ncbi:unnamed protein product [Vitrella brassicaformis CCMP3155]|uniref:AP-1 complex subunit gamma n=2 Tax=Vitrella brassicaformis TaxID=1169539 RepID=A0A0G4ELK5_VITBC|nr:unnamed protein product [Vitrella brassicaformis CCMP3155]|mmetsp:Transcript_34206/g.98476  ORF Transcript_34206/g.98476 Transcript_34206/m.98476 type:complete len:920 (+) Transcript_34206:152-2911(+)|eukprot:CEL98303.1 unnamed protein product [Vitrella brassicaformis CCMP3155]
MSIKLRELIRNIRACKTAAEERAVIAKECAEIRTAFKEEDNHYRHRNVAKLLFIHMLGYPTHFGQMECLKLIASTKFAEKRVGYLGLTQLLDENTEVLMLVTNSVKNDLNHPNQYVNGLALCALGNIGNPEMCRALAREVENLMGVSNPYIRKKAALCAMRMIRKVEEIEDKFNHKIPTLLEDRNHAVLLSGCALLITVLEINPSALSEFRRYVPTLIRALKNMSMSGYANASEYDIAGITDPFLQVKILRVLKLLGHGSVDVSDEMNDILAQVATNTEGAKNAGNAILYECVQTIMNIEAESGLRVLGVNILGRFLMNRDNNIRYVALTTLQHVVTVDMKAVQRHRSTIVDCLKDPDVSIRKRALDVTYALINEENIKTMTKELLNFLLMAGPEFKEDLVTKICLAVDRFAPNRRWQIDTLIKVMCLAGNFVQTQIRDNFIYVVMATPELHTYTVHKLFFSVKENQTQETLIQVGIWCLGEFGDLLVSGSAVGPDQQPIKVSPSEVLDLIETIDRRPTEQTIGASVMGKTAAAGAAGSSGGGANSAGGGGSGVGGVGSAVQSANSALVTQEYIITTLMKLTTRFPNEVPRIRGLLEKYSASMSLEIQQRACEYEQLLGNTWDKLREGILDRMPASERAKTLTTDRPSGDASIDEVPTTANHHPKGGDLLDLNDLLDLDTRPAPPGGAVLNSHPATQTSPHKPSTGGGDLLDLLGGLGGELAPSAGAPAPTAASGLDALADLNLGGPTLNSHPPPAAAAATAAAADAARPPSTGGDILDIFGGTPSPASPPTAPPAGGKSFPPFTAFDKNGLQITFTCKQDGSDPKRSTVEASFVNTSTDAMSAFVFEAAVPKYVTLSMDPASASVVEPFGLTPTTQRISLVNSAQGEKPIMMKIRISYTHKDQQVQEFGQVSDFPKEL